MIHFACPFCRHDLHAPEERAGAAVKCPRCEQPVSVPRDDWGSSIQPTVADPVHPPAQAVPAVLPSIDVRAPAYRLYSQFQVLLATFLGGPMAGFILAAVNFRRLRRSLAAWAMLAVGAAITIGVCILAVVTPDGRGAFLLVGLPGLLVTVGAVRLAQGSAHEEHVRSGGRRASNWGTIGAAVLGAAIMLGGFLGWEFLTETEEPKLTFGAEEEIYYAEGALEADARALGQALQKAGHFDGDGPSSVRLTREGTGFAIGFVVRRNAWNDEKTVEYYKDLRSKIAESAFPGQPVTFYLCDEELRRRKRIE